MYLGSYLSNSTEYMTPIFLYCMLDLINNWHINHPWSVETSGREYNSTGLFIHLE
jgi:hypothetical protein